MQQRLKASNAPEIITYNNQQYFTNNSNVHNVVNGQIRMPVRLSTVPYLQLLTKAPEYAV